VRPVDARVRRRAGAGRARADRFAPGGPGARITRDAGAGRGRRHPGAEPRRGGGGRGPVRLGWVALVAAAAIVAVAIAVGRGHGGSRAGTAVRARPIVRVVIPEGETRRQIAAIARADGLTGSYLAATARLPGLDPGSYGAPRGTSSPEGFLFPATYELYAGSPAARLALDQVEAFRERFGPGQAAAARALGLTPYELLIVASIVEREAGIPHDRPLIAAVLYNRLRLHMPLGVDATLRYALNDFTRPLTEAQLADRSPYNTRLHRGLPPTPIANPGLEAIEAAAHPAHVSYLYYVAAPDGCGESVFSDTYAQFLRDAAAYQSAIAANGGRVPACKHR
jgi:UPF0755 protein